MTTKERAVCYFLSVNTINWLKEYSAKIGKPQSKIITDAIIDFKNMVERENNIIADDL